MSPQNATAIYFSKRFSILVVISEEVKSWITEAEKGIEVACSEDGVESSVTEVVLKSGFALSVNKKKQFPDVLNKKKRIDSGSKKILSQHLVASPSVIVNLWANRPTKVWGFWIANSFHCIRT